MCASFFTLLSAIVEVDGTNMSPDSVYDQLVCRMWFTRRPLWCLLVTSTYGILLTALERYVAVVHHIWYKVTQENASIDQIARYATHKNLLTCRSNK